MESVVDMNLAEYTSWRVGGDAKHCFKPKTIAELSDFLKELPSEEPLLWLGLGSNLLIRDGGVKETVILTQGGLNSLMQVDELTIRAEAGVACGQLARYCARLNLTGLEFLAGIPGTVGGALAMNAGCHNGETWEWVQRVETIDQQGIVRMRDFSEFKIAYRHVKGPVREWFVAGYFQLKLGNKEQSLLRIKELLDHRARTQPIDFPNCGSVFRNPPGDYAGRLIELCGLKGFSLGKAQVSNKHANFIVNTGGATAAEIEQLIEIIMKQVYEKTGISLVREVHIRGVEK